MIAYGDSITTGAGVSQSYTAISAAAASLPLTNRAVSGAMAADVANQVYGSIPPDPDKRQRVIVNVGTNDERIYGTDANKRTIFHDALEAEAAWLALTTGRFTAGDLPAWTYTGTWADGAFYPGNGTLGRKATANGSTATATITGTVAYVAVSSEDGNTGQFTVAIDGGSPASYSVAGPATIATQNGMTHAPRLIRFSGLSAGAHTLVFTATTASSGSPVYLSWAAGVIPQPTWPKIFLCTITKQSAAGYVANGGSDANVAAYKSEIAAIVTELAGDGLSVSLADIGPSIDTATDLQSDGLHPNSSGHTKMAAVLTPLM